MDEEAKLLVVKNAKDNLLQDLSIMLLYKPEFRLSLCLK